MSFALEASWRALIFCVRWAIWFGMWMAIIRLETCIVHADTVVETASHLMGDNETRQITVDACVANAERAALEASGTIVDTELNVLKSDTSESAQRRVNGFVAGVVKGRLVSGSWDQDLKYTCTVEVTYDPGEIHRLLDRVAASRQTVTTATLTGENVIQHLYALTKRARSIRNGMTDKEVLKYMGEAPRVVHDKDTVGDKIWWQYGDTWVAMERSTRTVVCLSQEWNASVCRKIRYGDSW